MTLHLISRKAIVNTVETSDLNCSVDPNLYENQLLKILQILLVGISIFYIVTVTYIFPVLVHYKASALLSIKNAFLVGMLAPLTTLSIVLSTIIIAYLSLYLPGLFVFFTVIILII